jgi:hypothetical protein
MKKFVLNIILFSAIPLISLILGLLLLDYLNNRRFESFRIAPQKTAIVTGDSHIRMSINDSLLSRGITIAQESESFRFTYLKLSTLLPRNPNVKELYLGFSYHCLSDYYDVFGTEAKEVSARYFFILSAREKVEYLWTCRNSLVFYLQHIIEFGARNALLKRNPTFIGHYQNNFTHEFANKKSMRNRIHAQFYKDGTLQKYSFWNIHYLMKIINLCESSGVKLIFIDPPLHPFYERNIPEKFKMGYQQLLTQFGIPRIHFENIALDDHCFFRDGDHLSSAGARLTSLELNRLMNLPAEVHAAQ